MEVRDWSVSGRLDYSEEHLRDFYDIPLDDFRWALLDAGSWYDEEIEDHLGAFWLNCRERWHQYDPSRGGHKVWMFRRAKHYRRHYLRQKWGVRRWDDEAPCAATDYVDTLGGADKPATWGRLRASLSDLEADIVYQAVICGTPPQEINRDRGWSHNATYAILKRALDKIRKVLDKEDI